MDIVDFCQGSSDWLNWRKNGVSASEAGTVLGVDPYKTRWRLWAEKTDRAVPEDLSNNPFVQKGIAMEDRARQCAEKVLNEKYLPAVCASSSEKSFIRASFDGLTRNNVPVELKVPAESTFESVKAEGEASKAYQRYYPQVQQQIYVAESQSAWLMFYHPADDGTYELFEIERDDAFIEKLLEEATKFWFHITKDVAPDLDVERDLYIPQGDASDDWIFHATDYRLMKEQIREWEAKIKTLKPKLNAAQKAMESMMGDFYKADYAGVSITRFEKQGAINYERYLKENHPDIDASVLEAYRKPGSTQCRVTVTDDAMPKNIVDAEVEERLTKVDEQTSNSAYF